MSDFYTVSQFAEVSGKDTGNIRRLLIKGELPGEKVGKQWLISKEAVYPEDKRVKNGQYRNWRQRTRLNSKHPEIMKKLGELCVYISEIYGNSVAEIMLYGSYARGQETKESDIDLALVLRKDQTDEQYDRLTDIVVDYELDLGITMSLVSIKQSEFMEWKTSLPFYKNVEKEGIVLWKSA